MFANVYASPFALVVNNVLYTFINRSQLLDSIDSFGPLSPHQNVISSVKQCNNHQRLNKCVVMYLRQQLNVRNMYTSFHFVSQIFGTFLCVKCMPIVPRYEFQGECQLFYLFAFCEIYERFDVICTIEEMLVLIKSSCPQLMYQVIVSIIWAAQNVFTSLGIFFDVLGIFGDMNSFLFVVRAEMPINIMIWCCMVHKQWYEESWGYTVGYVWGFDQLESLDIGMQFRQKQKSKK
eukprot:TRINITY_DN24164_c0_g1_i3.p1 TRINITY_DN24164_c0_g1~~TRINITY_DN24164_c0_g1_i3.p1  ORF type:complete len:234 (+),score=13.38 TRINITY_DN24164_c0_g1_i3:287-988(+)